MMALSLDGQADPRSNVGQLARGANIYMGASKSPYAGIVTQAGSERMLKAPLLPQYKKPSLADVARNFLNGNKQQ